jgi:hypothetical protein
VARVRDSRVQSNIAEVRNNEHPALQEQTALTAGTVAHPFVRLLLQRWFTAKALWN